MKNCVLFNTSESERNSNFKNSVPIFRFKRYLFSRIRCLQQGFNQQLFYFEITFKIRICNFVIVETHSIQFFSFFGSDCLKARKYQIVKKYWIFPTLKSFSLQNYRLHFLRHCLIRRFLIRGSLLEERRTMFQNDFQSLIFEEVAIKYGFFRYSEPVFGTFSGLTSFIEVLMENFVL